MINTTRLRYVCSKSEENILQYLSTTLKYKVEIKQITFVKNKWYLWFILPEDSTLKESLFGDID